MRTNFEIDMNTAVNLSGIHFDLHNDFLFDKIDDSDSEFTIRFIKSNGDWAREIKFEQLDFIHRKVKYLHEEKGDNSKFPEDENILSFITFFPKYMRDINDGFMEHKRPRDNEDIIYHFENGKIFRLECDEVELKVK